MSPLQEPDISYQNLCSRKSKLLQEVISITEDLETIQKDIDHHRFWMDSCIAKQKDLTYFMFKTKKELQELQNAIDYSTQKNESESL